MIHTHKCARIHRVLSRHPAAHAAGRTRTLSALLLLVIAMSAGAHFGAGVELPPLPVAIAAGVVGALDLVGCALGMRGASQLLAAFEQQKSKSTTAKAM